MEPIDLKKILLSKDRKGFENMYDLYSDRLYDFIANVVSNEEYAEKILVQVFLKVWRSGPVAYTHTSPFIFLLQKSSQIIIDNNPHKSELKAKIATSIRSICKQNNFSEPTSAPGIPVNTEIFARNTA